jgi:hypothetical protein
MSAMRPGKSARFYRRCAALAALVVLLGATTAFGADPAYKLDLGLSVRSGSLRVEPTINGPSGKALRYEITIHREGRGRSADNNRAGNVRLDASGKGTLGYNSLSIAPGDRYVVTGKVYDGERLVAEESAHQP